MSPPRLCRCHGCSASVSERLPAVSIRAIACPTTTRPPTLLQNQVLFLSIGAFKRRWPQNHHQKPQACPIGVGGSQQNSHKSSSPARPLATMAAHHLPRLPVLLIVFLGVAHASTTHGNPLPASYNYSMCWGSSSWCGGVEIRYPFYLANATEAVADYSGSSSFSCGYTDLKIICQDEGETKTKTMTPIIQLGQDKYTVQSILYDTSTIVLADSDVLRPGDCPAVRHGVSFDQLWLHNTSSNKNITFFFGCNSESPPLNMYQIDCNGFRTPFGAGPSYVFTPDDHHNEAQEQDLGPRCAKVISVPVKSEVLTVIASNQTNFTMVGYGDALKQGFELVWSLETTNDSCYPCEQSGGRCAYGHSREFEGCLCPDGKVASQDCKKCRGTSRSKLRTYLTASTTSTAFLLLLFLAYLMYCKRTHGSFIFWRKRSYISPRVKAFLQRYGSLHPKVYSYAELKRMTKSFAYQLGKGGCGVVYKGKLPDGRLVAVKMLKELKGDDEQFMNEVASISTTSHVNIVTLLGFCVQGSKRALVYDYMPNGSLERFIFSNHSDDRKSLSWGKLFDIAVGIARGLEYLHRGCNTRIVHFDIKPHNILLDENFCPKISDFGLAKLSAQKESTISIGVARGTVGYIAPEVFSRQFGVVSSKSDVYSYGMMILEMVGSTRTTNDSNLESSSDEFYFPIWIYENLDQYCFDASEMANGAGELVRKMIVVGLWCVQVMPASRPSTSQVVEMLESDLKDLQLPSKPIT